MDKNNRRIFSFLASYAMLTQGISPWVKAKNQQLDLPTKGMKGLSNKELKAKSKPKRKSQGNIRGNYDD